MFNRRRAVAGTVGAVATLAMATGTMPGLAAGSHTSSDTDSARATYQRLTSSAKANLVKLDLLAINDFHGNLEVIPPTSSSGRINNTPAGGAAYLARHLQNLRQRALANGAHTITVAAGDLIGASPLISAAFHDEPTIETMNKVGLDVASVGNHEFDEGWRELRRMQVGGCLDDGDGENNQNSCPDPQHPFTGADFRYLSANVFWENQGNHPLPTLFPATKVMDVDGIKVGFIGMTLEGTPNIVTKAGVQGLEFTDEVETANALVPKLRERGVEAIVVLLHEGAALSDPTAYDGCTGASGPGLDIARQLSPQIDVVVSGHTHQAYNCVVRDPAGKRRLFTSASSFGRMITDLHLALNRQTRDVVRPAAYAQNRIVTNDAIVHPVASINQLIDKYRTLVEPIANKVIGHLDGTEVVSRTTDADGSGDSPLGNLIADAQKVDATTIPDSGPAQGAVPQIAFMNPGGIRADLLSNSGEVTFGQAFTVQPFNNFDVSMDLTGQQILDLLEQQWTGGNAAAYKILQVSGITYTWDDSNAGGSADPKVDVSTVMVDGDSDGVADDPIDPAATYRIVCNSFLSDGGDGFGVFADGANKYFGGLDIDALANYLTENDPYTPTATDRINVP
ncbi:MAG TPA: bifunctional metallophosphatase/5'-nucleotidase [Nocardioidaceae bacterium]|nr:bifunctional metallophosphatase/5'-nucleotidase [Nocardioidaceae bacterium]